jgi:hypothetical protein
MTLDQRIEAFVSLGRHLQTMDSDTRATLIDAARHENPWFTPENVQRALSGVSQYLNEATLRQWVSTYAFTKTSGKTVGLVMAGNIPLVGFHDLLCILISGHQALVKISSRDSKLNLYLLEQLTRIQPAFRDQVRVTEQLRDFDAVIATGSDNTARYFEYYFQKYPHIIRKNRSSVAILTGKETTAQLTQLGEDIFSYFGLGCRNVSKLLVPEGYSFHPLFESWNGYQDIIHHHKYCNNYDYQKSILLVNQVPFLDNGFVLLQESEKLVSPISVLYYQYYQNESDVKALIGKDEEKIQCIVGSGAMATVSFGQAQSPRVWDYADHVDTIKFLLSLG